MARKYKIQPICAECRVEQTSPTTYGCLFLFEPIVTGDFIAPRKGYWPSNIYVCNSCVRKVMISQEASVPQVVAHRKAAWYPFKEDGQMEFFYPQQISIADLQSKFKRAYVELLNGMACSRVLNHGWHKEFDLRFIREVVKHWHKQSKGFNFVIEVADKIVAIKDDADDWHVYACLNAYKATIAGVVHLRKAVLSKEKELLVLRGSDLSTRPKSYYDLVARIDDTMEHRNCSYIPFRPDELRVSNEVLK